MGLRFRKSFKAAPGVKINLNKKSVGGTLGTKGAHYTVNSKGKRTATVGIPGTGLSYTTSSGGKRKGPGRQNCGKAAVSKIIGILIAVVAIACAAGAMKSSLDKRAEAAAVTQNVPASGLKDTPSSPVTDAADPAASPNFAASGGPGTAAAQDRVWISGSGSKYHRTADCSGMKNAEEVSLQDAMDMGREPCKRCNP